MRIAILDDYAQAALRLADWRAIAATAEIVAFDRALKPDEMATALNDFDIICTMRERSTMPANLFGRLPRLALLTVTDDHVRTIDFAAAKNSGVTVAVAQPPSGSQRAPSATPEFAWGLILALVRNIPYEAQRLREGHWQSSLGLTLAGRTLGIVGLGKVGRRVAHYANAFDMQVVAWSQNLTPAEAVKAGATRVEKETLFRTSDIVTVHYVLSARSRGLVSGAEIAAMKPTAYLVNTSRGPVVEETALIAALRERRIAGAGLDVFDQEPLPSDHPLQNLDNVVLTPHLGFVTEDVMRRFFEGMADTIGKYLQGGALKPLAGSNPHQM